VPSRLLALRGVLALRELSWRPPPLSPLVKLDAVVLVQ
jgi:hypothetical protein